MQHGITGLNLRTVTILLKGKGQKLNYRYQKNYFPTWSESWNWSEGSSNSSCSSPATTAVALPLKFTGPVVGGGGLEVIMGGTTKPPSVGGGLADRYGSIGLIDEILGAAASNIVGASCCWLVVVVVAVVDDDGRLHSSTSRFSIGATFLFTSN